MKVDQKKIEKDYKELKKKKELIDKEKEKREDANIKKSFENFKKIFDTKYKGRCFYGVRTDRTSWDLFKIMDTESEDRNNLKVYYRINYFKKSYHKAIIVYFDTIYKVDKNILYSNGIWEMYDSINEFEKSIKEIEKHQEYLTQVYIDDKYDLHEDMYEKSKHGYSLNSDTIAKFFNKFKHLRCEIDRKEFNYMIKGEIEK